MVCKPVWLLPVSLWKSGWGLERAGRVGERADLHLFQELKS